MFDNITVIFRAKCLVTDTAIYSRTHPVVEGLRPNLYAASKFYPSIISLCEDPILPGKEGLIEIRAIALKADSNYFQHSLIFELREGPQNKLAQCEIVSEVKVEI